MGRPPVSLTEHGGSILPQNTIRGSIAGPGSVLLFHSQCTPSVSVDGRKGWLSLCRRQSANCPPYSLSVTHRLSVEAMPEKGASTIAHRDVQA
jgi:hypothetical protein